MVARFADRELVVNLSRRPAPAGRTSPRSSTPSAPKALRSCAEGGWLVPGTLAIIEEAVGAAIVLPAGFEGLEEREYGDTKVMFARYAA